MKTNGIIPLISLLLILPLTADGGGRYKDLEKTIPYEDIDELQVDIEIGIADLIIEQAEGDHLLEAKINYNVRRGEPEIRFKRSGKVGYLTIESGDKDKDYDKDGDKKGDERWELRFSPKVPISFDIEVGLVDGTLDMTGLKVIGLDISGGLSDIDLSFDKPNSEEIEEIYIEVGLGELTASGLGNANFKTLKLETGLGSAKLDLSGKWRIPEAEIKLEVGLGSARIDVPEEVAVEVLKEENFLSTVNLDRSIREVRKGLHRSANWDDAKYRVTIDAEVGLGSIKVRIMD